MFCPLQQHLNPMQTAAGVWSDCQLETNPLCWARQLGVVGRQHTSQISFSVASDISSNVVDFYFLSGVSPNWDGLYELLHLFCYTHIKLGKVKLPLSTPWRHIYGAELWFHWFYLNLVSRWRWGVSDCQPLFPGKNPNT